MRKAFETEARKHGFILDRMDKSGVYVQLITEQAWTVWQAATAAVLEQAAEVCDGYFSDLGSTWGKQQDAASRCARAIRALKDAE